MALGAAAPSCPDADDDDLATEDGLGPCRAAGSASLCDACQQTTLSSTSNGAGGPPTDDAVCFCRPVSLAIPETVSVTGGPAGGARGRMLFTDAAGVEVMCHYAESNGALAFVRCANGAQPGAALSAARVKLLVRSAGNDDRTTVSVALAEVEPCGGGGCPDGDADSDSVCDGADNCAEMANGDQTNTDGDARGDVCDPCPQSPGDDADGDGVCGDLDCDDADAARFPGASEVCGDGVDQDCDGADELCPTPDPEDIAPPPPPLTSSTFLEEFGFLVTHDPPVQTGVGAGVITDKRAAVVRGRVLMRGGAAASGVHVNVLGRPELGETWSRGDGRYDLLVNGGGRMTVVMERAGHVTLQRSAEVPWNQVTILPDATLTPRDVVSTVMEAGAAEPQVHITSVVADEDGARHGTLVVEAGTQMIAVAADGTTTPLSTVTLRSTELTVGAEGPSAMPAELPPTSLYTYCFDVSVDEAPSSSIALSAPVAYYVDNFIGLAVGSLVPVGSYDTSMGRWVGEDNARVVAVLEVVGGSVTLDTDGDGQADDGAALGVTAAERAALAASYPAGTSLMRMLLSHFDPKDANAPGVAPPAQNASGPGGDGTTCDKHAEGSIIRVNAQVLGESIPVSGTPFSLEYRSDRVRGRQAAFLLEADARSIVGTGARLYATGDVAGRDFIATVSGGSATYLWNGLDAFGRRVRGRAHSNMDLEFFGRRSYATTALCGGATQAFPLWSCDQTPEAEARGDQLSGHLNYTVPLGIYEAKEQRLGGFTLSAHHVYLPREPTIYLGSGGRRDGDPTISRAGAQPLSGTLAPRGGQCPPFVIDGNEDGTPAACTLLRALALSFFPDGRLVLSDNVSVYTLDFDGTLEHLAGPIDGDTPAGSGDGGPALEAGLGRVVATLVLDDGSVLLANTDIMRVRRVRPDGIIEAYAGDGSLCDELLDPACGDGGPAASAALAVPSDLAMLPDGTVLIADRCSVRRVDHHGIITTVAGSRDCLGNNETLDVPAGGVLANQARFEWLSGLAVTEDGVIGLFDDHSWAPRLYAIDSAGMMRTPTDGGVSPEAPQSGEKLVAAAGGAFYVLGHNEPLLRVSAEGFSQMVISELPGGGSLDDIAIDPGGDVVASGGYQRRLWGVIPPFGSPVHIGTLGEVALPSADGRELFVFNSRGRHLRTVDERTNITLYTFAHDADGLLVGVTDRDGLVTSIERDLHGDATAIVGPYGERTELAINGDGYLVEVVRADGERVAFEYDGPGGLMTAMVDARGGPRRYQYDSMGRLLRAEDPTGAAQTFTRERLPTITRVVHETAEGRTTVHDISRETPGAGVRFATNPDLTVTATERFDGNSVVVRPDGTTVTTTREPDPRLGGGVLLDDFVTTRLPSGLSRDTRERRQVTVVNGVVASESWVHSVNERRVTTTWNASSRTRVARTELGRTTRVVQDALARPVELQVGNLLPTFISYDADGRPEVLVQGARTTTLGYGADGRLQTVTDAEGSTTTLARDAIGRVTETTLPGGASVAFGYDENGNLTSLTPPGRPAHEMSYTPADLLGSETAPAVGALPRTTTRAYDGDRLPTVLTLPSGRTVTTAYDFAGRAATTTFDGDTITMSYHPTTGKLLALDSTTGVDVAYQHNGMLRTRATFSGAVNGSVDWTYSSYFEVRAESVAGLNVSSERDRNGSLTNIDQLTLTYDPTHGAITNTTAGLLSTAFTHNGHGEVERADTGPLLSMAYRRDGLGRITEKIESRAGAASTVRYGYDDAGRLALEEIDGAATTFAYDANGNRLQAGSQSCTYDDRDRLIACGGTSFDYNDDGQLAARDDAGAVTTFDYDARGGLRRVILPDGTDVEYLLDATGRRVGKMVDGVLVKQWLWSDALKIAAELDGAGELVARFVYGTRSNVPDLVIKRRFDEELGEVLTRYRVLHDHLGSPLMVVDIADGAVVQERAFDAWGNTVFDTNPGFIPFGFAGGLEDVDTGLVRFGARDYHPETGRWTAGEVIGFPGSVGLNDVAALAIASATNPYSYTVNDPVNLIDSDGEAAMAPSSFPCCACAPSDGDGDICAGDDCRERCLCVWIGGCGYPACFDVCLASGRSWFACTTICGIPYLLCKSRCP